MTTPVPDWLRIVEIKDLASLQLVSRLVASQITVLQSQLAQLTDVKKMVDERVRSLSK